MNAPARIAVADAAIPATTLAVLPLVLAARVEQIAMGHSLAADIERGPQPLIADARARILRTQQGPILPEIDRLLQAASDQAGNPAHLRDARCIAVLTNRLAKAAALCLAAIETVQAITEQDDES